MRLLLVRHAIAEDLPRGAVRGDSKRRLTDEGRRKMKKAARGLASLVPDLALVATSPYLRAQETAAILIEAYPKRLATTELAALAPGGDCADVIRFVAGERSLPAIALVGHEPSLSSLAARLVAGREDPLFELRKGGAALLEFDGRPTPGNARLVALLPASALRDLG